MERRVLYQVTTDRYLLVEQVQRRVVYQVTSDRCLLVEQV